MFRRRSNLLYLSLSLLALFGVVLLSPPEQTLGPNAHIVYLHGAWVWTALLCFAASALLGILGLMTRRFRIQHWSIVVGRAGLLFWLIYLPMSLLAMQANWNGLFLEEPRWRLAFDFAMIGMLFQASVLLVDRPAWGSAINVAYMVALGSSLLRAEHVMHPPAALLLTSDVAFKLTFAALTALCALTAWHLSRLLYTKAYPEK